MACGRFGAVVLSAGRSTRMGGRPKALLPLEGRSFLETILARLDEAGVEERRVVLGVHAPEILEALPLPEDQVVRNPDHDAEMIDSFRLGLRSLPLETLEGVLLWPVDHPHVSSGTVSLLLREAGRSGAPVVLPAHGGRRGHPVVFATRLAPEIETAPASEGARAVVRAHEGELLCIELSDPGVLRDVDTPEDLE
jgi:nicotine blue oxidoreductase